MNYLLDYQNIIIISCIIYYLFNIIFLNKKIFIILRFVLLTIWVIIIVPSILLILLSFNAGGFSGMAGAYALLGLSPFIILGLALLILHPEPVSSQYRLNIIIGTFTLFIISLIIITVSIHFNTLVKFHIKITNINGSPLDQANIFYHDDSNVSRYIAADKNGDITMDLHYNKIRGGEIFCKCEGYRNIKYTVICPPNPSLPIRLHVMDYSEKPSEYNLYFPFKTPHDVYASYILKLKQ